MGCDYYIIKRLRINLKGLYDYETIELNRDRCYFPDYNDINSDDSCYDEKIEQKYKNYLTVKYEPITLFEHNSWKNEKIKEKYTRILNEKYNLDNVESIIKEEVRQLR